METPVPTTAVITTTPPAPAPPATPKPKSGKLHFWIREIISVFFWVYLIAKLFVFDFDVFLIQRFAPQWQWLIYGKFFVFIGTIAFVWLFTKNSQIARWLLYITFYPLILCCRIIYLLLKKRSWLLIIGVVNFIVSLFRFAKYRFIVFALSTIAFALIFFSNNYVVIDTLIVSLLFFLTMAFIRHFYYAFRPSALYQTHT